MSLDDVKLELDSKPHTLYNIDRAIAKLGTVSALIIELHGNAKISCQAIDVLDAIWALKENADNTLEKLFIDRERPELSESQIACVKRYFDETLMAFPRRDKSDENHGV